MDDPVRPLILPPRYTQDSIALWRAAVRDGRSVTRLSSWRVPDDLLNSAGVIYAEPLFAHVVAEPLGVALLEPAFDWLTTLPANWLGREVRYADLAGARSVHKTAFIKPGDDKCFPAAVYSSGAELPGNDVLPADTPVLIADPVHWTVEYRCFIRDRACRTMSVYLRDGELARDEDGRWQHDLSEHATAESFVSRLLAEPAVRLPPAVVVDVGLIEGVGWAVVEANAAWGSGIYGCDPAEVLAVVERACVPTMEVSEVDAAWTRA